MWISYICRLRCIVPRVFVGGAVEACKTPRVWRHTFNDLNGDVERVLEMLQNDVELQGEMQAQGEVPGHK